MQINNTTKNTHNDSQHTDSNSRCTLIDIQNLPRVKNLLIWGKIAKSSAEKEKMNRKILTLITKFWMSRECRCLVFLAIYYYSVCAQGCFLLLCELKSISVMFARNGHSEVPYVLPQILDHFQNY